MELTNEFSGLYLLRALSGGAGLHGACLGVGEMSPRMQAAIRARELKRRKQAQEAAQTVVIWFSASLATFWAAYGFANWVAAL